MAQKVLFPGTHMRITQDEYGVTSHKGSLARDDGGESTASTAQCLHRLMDILPVCAPTAATKRISSAMNR